MALDVQRVAQEALSAATRRQLVLSRRRASRQSAVLVHQAQRRRSRCLGDVTCTAMPLAAGFGLRGASCQQMLSSAFLPGDVASLSDVTVLLPRCSGGVILVGSAVEAHGTTLELARHAAEAGCFVAAAVAAPYAFEGARKAAAAQTAISLLRQYAKLVVVVDQEVLMAEMSEKTLAGATQEANATLTASVAALRLFTGCSSYVRRDVTGATCRSIGSLSDQLAALGNPAPVAFGSGSAPLSLPHTPAEAVAACTAAACAAVASPFLADKLAGQPAGTCLCLVRAQAPLAEAVLDAAAMALGCLLPSLSLALAAVVDPGAVHSLAVDLFVLPTDAATAPLSSPTETSSAPRDSYRQAVRQVGGASVDTPRSAPAGAPVYMVDAHVVAAALDDLPPVPLSDAPSADDRTSSLFARLLGLDKSAAPPSVSQRASAALASDRAASRSVTRLTWADGGSYEGETDADGQPHGVGRRIYANGAWFAGEWQHGQRHGWGVSQTGTERLECMWADGRPQVPERAR